MKIYISGRISGLPIEKAKENFKNAENRLKHGGLETVNPFDNGLGIEATWSNHLAKDIELLCNCDGIYMMKDWKQSKGAMIERYVAIVLNKEIMYECVDYDCVDRIKNAIFTVTGKKFEEYTTKDREQELVRLRMMFAYLCKLSGLSSVKIAKLIGFKHSTVYYLKNQHITEYKYNEDYKQIFDKISELLQ